MGQQAYHAQVRYLPWLNEHDTACIPYGAIEVTGWSLTSGAVILRGTRPTGVSGKALVFNGPAAVGPGGYGQCTDDSPTIVAVGLIVGTTALNDGLVVTPDSWQLTTGSSEVVRVALGVSSNGMVLANRPLGSAVGQQLLAGTMQSTAVPGGSGLVLTLSGGQTYYCQYDHLASTQPATTLAVNDPVQIAWQGDVTVDPTTGGTSSSGGYRIVSWPCASE